RQVYFMPHAEQLSFFLKVGFVKACGLLWHSKTGPTPPCKNKKFVWACRPWKWGSPTSGAGLFCKALLPRYICAGKKQHR
ncbi:MAG: hypothetical protein KDD28_16765, partial [Phaeodactylibacter sp.]|nr:hypothetical protein [Phaeodactylibacter sp.]